MGKKIDETPLVELVNHYLREGHTKDQVGELLKGMGNQVLGTQLFADELLPTQGARAGRSGRTTERMFEACFEGRVRVVNDNPEFHGPDLWDRKDKLLIRQVRNGRYKMDWLFKNFRADISLPIEMKGQQGSGSTDEKLSYTVNKLIGAAKALNCKGYWLILNGRGFNFDVVQNIQTQINASNLRDKLRGSMFVFDIVQRRVDALIERGEI